MVRTPVGFLDARLCPLSDRHKVMFLILEGMARDSALCIPGNATLAEMTDKTERGVQDVLDGLEKAGRIRRVYADAKRRTRVAILLLERVDPNLPRIPADSADRAATAVLECRKLHTESEGNIALCAMKTSLSGMQKTSPEALRMGTRTKSTREGVASPSRGGGKILPSRTRKVEYHVAPPKLTQGQRAEAERERIREKVRQVKARREAAGGESEGVP